MSAPLPYNDKALLADIAAGDHHAFKVFYEQYQPLLTTHIYRLTRSSEQANEYTQDVFLKIWQNRILLTDITHIKAYLAAIARNYTLNAIRQLAADKQRQEAWFRQHLQQEEEMDHRQVDHLYTLLDEAIEQLPAQQKKVYLMARKDQLTYGEIARIMNLSPGTVKRYLQISKESIAAYLRENSTPDLLQWFIILTCSGILK